MKKFKGINLCTRVLDSLLNLCQEKRPPLNPLLGKEGRPFSSPLQGEVGRGVQSINEAKLAKIGLIVKKDLLMSYKRIISVNSFLLK